MAKAAAASDAAAPMAATPQTRRKREDGTEATGLTPAAKRATARPDMVEPPSTQMSLIELTTAFVRLQSRYEFDLPWFGAMAEAVTDHTARLDIMRDIQKTTI